LKSDILIEKGKLLRILSLSAVLIAGVLLRLWFIEQNPILSRDGEWYLGFYIDWSSGHFSAEQFKVTAMPPVLFLGSHLFSLIGFSPETAMRGFSFVCSILLIGVVSYWLKDCFSSWLIGLLSAIFIAFCPSAIDWSIQIQRESPYLLFGALNLWCFSRWQSTQKWIYIIMGGCSLALTAMSRYEGLELLPLWGCFGIIKCFPITKSRSRNIMQLLSFGAIFFVSVLLLLFLFAGYDVMEYVNRCWVEILSETKRIGG